MLARAVLVAEGATEVAVLLAIADVLDADPAVVDYLHPDLAGLSIFDANNDVSVPVFAPVFAGMGKPVFGLHDTPNKPFDAALMTKTDRFTRYTEIPYKGIELLLVTEVPVAVQRRFAAAVAGRADYPTVPALAPNATDDQIRNHVRQLLQERKGSNGGYAALLIAECANATELPTTLRDFMIAINADLRATATPRPADETDDG